MVNSERKELHVEGFFYAYPFCQEHLKHKPEHLQKTFLFKKIYGMMLFENWPE